jgi:Chaperone of endosialidase
MGDLGNVAGFGRRSLFVYTATAGQTTFSGADLQTYTLSYDVTQKPNVWVEGRIASPLEFTATTGSTIVFGSAFTGGEQVVIEVFGTYSPANTYSKTETDALKVAKAGDTMTGPLALSSTDPAIDWYDSNGPTDKKRFKNYVHNGIWHVERYTDAGVYVDTPFYVDGSGSYAYCTVAHSPPTGDDTGRLISSSWLRSELGSAVGFDRRYLTKGTLPGYLFWDTDAGTNQKRAGWHYNADTLSFDRHNDDGSTRDTPFSMDSNGRVNIASLEATAELQAGTDGSLGYVKLMSGDSGNCGYVAIHRPSGVRAGYIGWGAGTSSLAVELENTDYFEIQGGGLKAGSGVFGRQGASAGGYGAGTFNWHWTGSAIQAWVDASNVGTYQMVSDERFKHSIAPLAIDALGAITELRPVTYRWRDHGIFIDDGKDHIGFIAQEVGAVIPDAVTIGDDEDNTQTINTTPLLATIVAAMQQMAARITALEGAAA